MKNYKPTTIVVPLNLNQCTPQNCTRTFIVDGASSRKIYCFQIDFNIESNQLQFVYALSSDNKYDNDAQILFSFELVVRLVNGTCVKQKFWNASEKMICVDRFVHDSFRLAFIIHSVRIRSSLPLQTQISSLPLQTTLNIRDMEPSCAAFEILEKQIKLMDTRAALYVQFNVNTNEFSFFLRYYKKFLHAQVILIRVSSLTSSKEKKFIMHPNRNSHLFTWRTPNETQSIQIEYKNVTRQNHLYRNLLEQWNNTNSYLYWIVEEVLKDILTDFVFV